MTESPSPPSPGIACKSILTITIVYNIAGNFQGRRGLRFGDLGSGRFRGVSGVSIETPFLPDHCTVADFLEFPGMEPPSLLVISNTKRY